MAEQITIVPEQAPDSVEPPEGFRFNPESMASYDEQVGFALANAAYQAAPAPSFEGVPQVDIVPVFNPTGAPPEEIYARGRVPQSFRILGWKTQAESTGADQQVDMWRIVERSKVVDGTGLVSSKILHSNSVGDVEGFDAVNHMASNHGDRMSTEDNATPFVSFSTDPVNLAERVILLHGFGIKDGRDSVIVQVRVAPDRVISPGRKKEQETLLLGGLAQDEFVAAYELDDFVSTIVAESFRSEVDGKHMSRDELLHHWRG